MYNRKDIRGFVSIDTVLDMLDKEKEEAIKKYRALMAEKVEEDYEKVKIRQITI